MTPRPAATEVAELRKCAAWDPALDAAGIGGPRIGHYLQPSLVDNDGEMATELTDVCIRNGLYASAADDVASLLLRLASINVVATTRLVRPEHGPPADAPQPVVTLKQDIREATSAYCSWCKRVALHELVETRVGRRSSFVCQSCLLRGRACQACTKAGR